MFDLGAAWAGDAGVAVAGVRVFVGLAVEGWKVVFVVVIPAAGL